MDTAALIEFTQALVRVPSVNDAGRREEAAAELVAGLMRSWGWTPVLEPVAPGRPNVHAVLDGGRPGPTLLFCGHTDVVTEGSGWSVDPFGAQIRDGRLYGRGSADMKGGLAAMLFAAREVQNASFAGRIVVAALADEEGMMRGSKHFAARYGDGIDGAIVCEPEAEEICLTAKGALRLRIDAHGAMAHGAMPDHGRNPLPVLGAVLVGLARLQERMHAEVGVDEHLGRPFLTPTVLRAGDPDQLNVIGADAWLGLDIRTVPGQDHGRIVEDVAALAAEAGAAAGVRTAVSVIDDRPAMVTPPESAVVAAVLAAHREVTGTEGVIGGVPGATDGTILWRDAGIPVVVYGPGGKWIAHQVDEFVEIDDIVRKAEVYVRAARLFLSDGA